MDVYFEKVQIIINLFLKFNLEAYLCMTSATLYFICATEILIKLFFKFLSLHIPQNYFTVLISLVKAGNLNYNL